MVGPTCLVRDEIHSVDQIVVRGRARGVVPLRAAGKWKKEGGEENATLAVCFRRIRRSSARAAKFWTRSGSNHRRGVAPSELRTSGDGIWARRSGNPNRRRTNFFGLLYINQSRYSGHQTLLEQACCCTATEEGRHFFLHRPRCRILMPRPQQNQHHYPSPHQDPQPHIHQDNFQVAGTESKSNISFRERLGTYVLKTAATDHSFSRTPPGSTRSYRELCSSNSSAIALPSDSSSKDTQLVRRHTALATCTPRPELSGGVCGESAPC